MNKMGSGQESKYNRIFLKSILIISTMFLVGCSPSDMLTKAMLDKSGISQNAAYVQYEQYAAENKIDENGYIKFFEEQGPVNSAHISFTSNNNIDVSYYYDSNMDASSQINDYDCYLTSGQSIYVKAEPKADNDAYIIKGVNIYQYNGEDGTRKCIKENSLIESPLAISYSDDMNGQEFSIEVVGMYQNRVFKINDYYTDNNGNNHTLDEKWFVNDKEFTGDTASVSSTASYIVSYEYPADEYFVLDTEPSFYYANMDEGLVVFNQRTPEEETVEYKVVLHPYISISLVSGSDRSISINVGEKISYKANNEIEIPSLRYGEEILLTTDREWDSLRNNDSLILTDEAKKGANYIYKLYVPTPGAEFEFNPADYIYEHGEVTFTCFGSEITSTRLLPQQAKIYCTQKSADEGYWLGDDAIVVTVTTPEETAAQLNLIHFTDKIPVTVNLPQPADGGGTIEYSIDNERVYGDSVQTYSGTEITMKCTAWQGWYASTMSGSYVVTGVNGQVAKVGVINVNDVFTEDQNHKPVLNVKLKKSVGTSMKIECSIGHDNLTKSENYEDNWLGVDKDLVKNLTIGTGAGIDLSLTDCSIPSGQAVKIEVVKKATDNSKTTELYYIDILPNDVNIPIYDKSEIATSPVRYKSIDITVSVVDVNYYNSAKLKIDNTTLTVKNKLTGKYLLNGDIVEPGEIVVVTLKPYLGYYMEKVGGLSNDVSNDIYQKEMKYSDYVNNAASIKNNYAVKKYYVITLDSTDSFAKYTYSIKSGLSKTQISSGKQYIKDGTEIELAYEITDGKHNIVTPTGIGQSKTKAIVSVKVTPDMDGSILTKASFGVSVK